MDLPILYIGLSQSFFAVIVILMKKPLKIADVILGIFLMAFAVAFGLDILQIYGILPDKRWVISLSLFMLFAPLLYLYSKYVTKEFYSFNRFDYIHAIPPLLLIFLFLILTIFSPHEALKTDNSDFQFIWLRNSFGYIFNILCIAYVYYALRNVMRFKKQIKHFYSYTSDNINLNWLLFVIISFVLIFLMIVISSTLFEFQKVKNGVDMFRHIVELFFVYIISIWGFRQTQLNSEFKSENSIKKEPENKESSFYKYQKSGLKDDQAEKYLHELIDFMERTESWKDIELSVAKISAQTNIPKHHITQVLNEYLCKNFYQFVNEYRIENAKKLLKSEKCAAWSIVAIAYECGFNSKTAFNNFFKKSTNLTPSEFRKKSI
jgi:AraC-like DNA-binding protein